MWGFALLQNKHTISLKLSLTSNHYVFGGSFICVQINEPRRSDSGDESSFRRKFVCENERKRSSNNYKFAAV